MCGVENVINAIKVCHDQPVAAGLEHEVGDQGAEHVLPLTLAHCSGWEVHVDEGGFADVKANYSAPRYNFHFFNLNVVSDNACCAIAIVSIVGYYLKVL